MATRERPAEYAILGLLVGDDPGSHGYDLARHFGPDQPLGEVLRLEPGMLYHHLKRLGRAGLVTSTIAQEGSRPPKQVYQITGEGRAELDRWLQSPVAHTREIRLEFLVKLFFARQLDPEIAAGLVQTQLATLRQLHGALSSQQSAAAPGTGDAGRDFMHEVRALRLAQTAAAIAWLESL
jgi:DNA-binding PadR family transcriptional regulator